MWKEEYKFNWPLKKDNELSMGSKRSNEYYNNVAKRIKKNLNISLEDNVLDYGCSNGLLTNIIVKNTKSIIGIDFVPELIERAKIIAKSEKLSNIDYYSGDLTDKHKIDLNNIDKVYLHSVIHNLDYYENFEKLVQNFLKLLSKEKKIYILFADVPNCRLFNQFLSKLPLKQKIIYSCDRFLSPKIYNFILNIRNRFRKGTMNNTLWYSEQYLASVFGDDFIVKEISEGTEKNHRSDFLVYRK